MKLVIAGGGTGGHIFAGVAIAQEFLSQSKANEVLFVGSDSGLETRLVPKAGFQLETLHLGKLMGQSLVTRIVTLFQIPIAIFRCFQILRRFKTDMVIGVGGYAAGPCIVAARLLRIKIGVLEQNSVMGFTNRVAAALADQLFIAFDSKHIVSNKCIVTGNPSRSQLKPNPLKLTSSNDSTPFVLFAFGGSQGASGLNKLMLEAAEALLRRGVGIEIIHQTGERDYDFVVEGYKKIGIHAEVHRFIDNMQAIYDRASLVVCRAGSGTISELGATQNAAIFIPFPLAAANHQELNARIVENAGAARVLIQGKSSGADLAALIEQIRSDRAQLEKMRSNMANFHRPDAAKRIVEIMKIQVLKSS